MSHGRSLVTSSSTLQIRTEDMHILRSDHWRLWLDPEQGVRWCMLEARQARRDGHQWLAVTPDCRPADHPDAGPSPSPLNAASFLMCPYSNRIRDGRFHFRGKDYQLENAEKHAMHGALRKLPWRVTKATNTHLECCFDSREHEKEGNAPINWPWPLEAKFDHVLRDDWLFSEIALTNKGDADMPAGVGWHPYFLREIGGAKPSLQLTVSGVFPDTDGDCLPVGAPLPLPEELDYTTARALDPDQRIDHCFAGQLGNIELMWPDANLRIQMRSNSMCQFAVLYNPPESYFAVEPVSNANDAFNLEAQGIEAGMHVVAPNETLRFCLRLARMY